LLSICFLPSPDCGILQPQIPHADIMTSMLASYVTKRIFKEGVANKFGQEDPYFERMPATRLGKPSKKGKKRRKAAPPGLSDNDVRVLTQVKRRAYRLDMSLFNCCGLQFGWGSVIGIIPWVGDAFDCFMALMVLRTCRKIDGGLPERLRTRMMLNIIIDFAVGLVPILGDIADAVYKCNTRNAVILEHYLRDRGEKNLKKQGLAVIEDPSLPEHYDRHIHSESAESLPRHHQDISHDATGPAPVARLTQSEKTHTTPAPPPPAKDPGKKRWSFSGNKRAGTDVQSGPPVARTAIDPPARSSSKLKKSIAV